MNVFRPSQILFIIALLGHFSLVNVYAQLVKKKEPEPALAQPVQPQNVTAPQNLPAPNKEFEQLDFANGLFGRGLYEMAQGEYEQLIELNPSKETLSQAYFGLAESRFFLKNFPQAVDAYKKYLEISPSGKEVAVAKIRLGHLLVQIADSNDAIAYLKTVEPAAVNASFQQLLYYSLGQAHANLKNISKAMEYFNKATEITPNTNYTVLSYLQMGDIILQEKDYRRAASFYAQAEAAGSNSQQKAIALFKQGQTHMQLGDLAKAVEFFENILKNYEKEEVALDAFYQLLWVYTTLNQPKAVIESYQKYKQLVNFDPKFTNIHHVVIDAQLQTKNYDDAIATLDKLNEMAASDAAASRRNLMKKAQVLSQAERFDQALKIVEENLQNFVDAKDQALLLQAEAYYGLKDYAKAFSLYEQIVKEFSQSPLADQAAYGMAFAKNALGESKSALEFFNNYYQNGKNETNRQKALYNSVLLSAKLDLHEDALKNSQQYLSVYASGEYAEKVLYLLATLYGKLERHEDAAQIFTRYIVTYPQSSQLGEAYFALAYQSQLAGKLDQAKLYYEKAAANEANKDRRYSSLKNLAAICLNQKDTVQAVAIVERMISEYKENDLDIASYLWLAEYYVNQKKYDDVLRILQAAQDNPKIKDKDSTGGVFYFMAEAYRQKGEHDKAVEFYNKVISQSTPGIYLSEAKVGKASILMAQKKFDEARQIFTEIIESNTDNNLLAMKTRFALGELEEQQGHANEAIKYYMLVAVLYKNDTYSSQALFKAASLLETQGKSQEARQAYQEIITGYPQSEFIEQAKKRIEVLSGQ